MSALAKWRVRKGLPSNKRDGPFSVENKGV